MHVVRTRTAASLLAAAALLVAGCSHEESTSDRAADVLTSTYPAPSGWAAISGERDANDQSGSHVRDVNDVPVLFTDNGDGRHHDIVSIRYARLIARGSGSAEIERVCQQAARWFVSVDAGLSSGLADGAALGSSCIAGVSSGDGDGGVFGSGAHDDESLVGKYGWDGSIDPTRDGTQVSVSLTYDPVGAGGA